MAEEINVLVGNWGLIWGILSIIFGLVILAFPKILNYLIALYFIVTGILWIIPSLSI